MEVLNFFIIKHFKNTIANVGSLQYDIQYIKIIVAGTEVESIFGSLKHQLQVAHDKALKKRKRKYNKSNMIKWANSTKQKIKELRA